MKPCVLCFILGCLSVPIHAEPLDIYILAGQSNMVGGGDASLLDPSIRAPAPEIQFHYDVYTLARHIAPDWMDLVPNGTTWPPYIPNSGYGPEVGFGHTIAKTLNKDIALIKVAHNGTNLHTNWNPDATDGLMLYQRLVDHVGLAVAQLEPGTDYRFAGFVWVQGSGDAISWAAVNYEENLNKLISRLRSDLNTPDLSMVLNRYHIDSNRDDAAIARLRAEQLSFADHDERAGWINSDDLILKSDYIHYETDQFFTMGQRLAWAQLDFEDRAAGDTNFDGVIDQQDLNAVLAYYGGSGFLPQGDLNADRLVDDRDLADVLRHWNVAAAPVLEVPEPAAGVVLGLLAVFVGGGRGRRG